jgi:hypothetical protein
MGVPSPADQQHPQSVAAKRPGSWILLYGHVVLYAILLHLCNQWQMTMISHDSLY